MRQKSNSTPASSETLVRNIRRATRKHHAAEEKIRIVLDGLRGETSIVELCRREGIAESMYYSWSKEFLEAGKRRLAGDTARAATTDEVKQLRREAQDLKEVVAEQALELRLRVVCILSVVAALKKALRFQLSEFKVARKIWSGPSG